MTVFDLPASSNWSKLLREYDLVNLFCKMFVPGMAQNDLLLEIVMLIANIATDPQVFAYVINRNLKSIIEIYVEGGQHFCFQYNNWNALSIVERERR